MPSSQFPFPLDRGTSRFRLKSALALAQASRLAYRGKRAVREVVTGRWNMKDFRFFDRRDTQCFVCADAQTVVLAFRGTESLRDWLTDAKARLVPAGPGSGRGGRAHRGFVGALGHVWDDVAACVNDFQDGHRPVWVAGHSLGGALATLAALRLAADGVDVRGVYTFGAPRAGNRAFAKTFDHALARRTFRFVNNEDIVTRVPPRLLGYRHTGTVIYFDDKGVMHRGIRRWRVAMNRWASATRRACTRYDELRAQNPNSLADHSLDRYIRNIKKNLRPKKIPKTFLEYVNE